MANAGDRPPRYGNIEPRGLSYRRVHRDQEVSPTGSHQDQARLPNNSLFYPIAGACPRDVERFMKHPQARWLFVFKVKELIGINAALIVVNYRNASGNLSGCEILFVPV